jgi:hypothetical protein
MMLAKALREIKTLAAAGDNDMQRTRPLGSSDSPADGSSVRLHGADSPAGARPGEASPRQRRQRPALGLHKPRQRSPRLHELLPHGSAIPEEERAARESAPQGQGRRPKGTALPTLESR